MNETPNKTRSYSISRLVEADLDAFPPADFERFILWTSAPKPSPTHGRHYVELRMVLRGPRGAVGFTLYTGWDHSDDRHTADGKIACLDGVRREPMTKPIPASLSFHSPTPIADGNTIIKERCEYLGDRPCYGGESGSLATDPFDQFTDHGEQALWDSLLRFYNDAFGVVA